MSGIEVSSRFFDPILSKSAAQYEFEAVKALKAIANHSCVGSEWTGWYGWPEREGIALQAEIKAFQESCKVPYDTIVVVGIGGSYLGTKAISDLYLHSFAIALRGAGKATGLAEIVYLGQHLSEAGMLETLDYLDQRQPLVVVVSKSGTTTEPGVAFRVVKTYLEERFGKDETRSRIIAITDEKTGALRQLATAEKYKTFDVPGDVGGRFSVLTAVGLVPLTMSGIDCAALLRGADGLFRSLKDVSATHPVIQYATFRMAAFAAGKRIEILAFNEPKVAALAEWWKQLYGESEGKGGAGLFPASVCYTTDLHSLGQYVQDGARTMIETFLTIKTPMPTVSAPTRRLTVPRSAKGDPDDQLGYLEGRAVHEINEAAMTGTKMAHRDGGVPCLEIVIESLSPAHLGELLAFFEVACGVSGALLGVNPYDQPGVEAYKTNLFELLGKPR